MSHAITNVLGRAQTYMQTAAWRRKESVRSATPEQFLFYAENQELLANHMRECPIAYIDTGSLTDWQTYQKFWAVSR